MYIILIHIMYTYMDLSLIKKHFQYKVQHYSGNEQIDNIKALLFHCMKFLLNYHQFCNKTKIQDK